MSPSKIVWTDGTTNAYCVIFIIKLYLSHLVDYRIHIQELKYFAVVDDDLLHMARVFLQCLQYHTCEAIHGEQRNFLSHYENTFIMLKYIIHTS